MKSFAAIIVALAAIAGSYAQAPCSLTQPVTNTVYQAGKPAIIAWIQATGVNFSQIILAQGNPAALTTISVVDTNIPTAPGSYTWNIPATVPAGSNYALEIGTQPNVAYSGLFIILAADGSSPTAGASAAASTPIVVGTTPVASATQAGTTVVAVTSAAAGTGTSGTAAAGSSTSPSSAATTVKNAAPAVAVEFKTVFGALAAVAVLAML